MDTDKMTGTLPRLAATERFATLSAGGALALHGLRRGGAGGVLEALFGAALAYHGATGRWPMPGAAEPADGGARGDAARSEAPRFVHVQHVLTILKPREEIFAYWRRLENLPSFMRHLESVTALDERRSRWVAHAPLGFRVEWEAEIVEDRPGERIAWRSVEGSDVANSGAVSFRPAPADRGTEVSVSLEYAPPGGRMGDVVSRIFRENPDQQIKDDLRRFKQLMEAGEIPTTEGQPSGKRGITIVGTVVP